MLVPYFNSYVNSFTTISVKNWNEQLQLMRQFKYVYIQWYMLAKWIND